MTQHMPPPPPAASTNPGIMPYIVYTLYLVSLVFGITGVVGVIIAYINKDDAPHWVQTHYRFQIRTFWIGLLICIIGVILTLVLIGWLILLGFLIWLIIRVVKGIKYYSERRPIPNPETWMSP